jgi:hypothetical protein
MRLLLDSHTLIWWVDQDRLLSQAAHAAITDPANDLLLSAATIWEIAMPTSGFPRGPAGSWKSSVVTWPDQRWPPSVYADDSATKTGRLTLGDIQRSQPSRYCFPKIIASVFAAVGLSRGRSSRSS